jgi:3-hydroxybutyryl-CoA dehydrogenase
VTVEENMTQSTLAANEPPFHSAMDSSTRVAVVGAGSMGAGIAQLAAQAGHPVVLYDTQAGAAAKAIERISADLDAAVERKRIDAAERARILARLSRSEDFSAIAGAGLLVEAIVERLEAKRELLAERIAPPQAIDRLLRDAGGFAMGPFELIDLIGVDVNLSVTESVFTATFFDGRYAPNPIQQELVRSGRYGRKTGAGFYNYADGAGPPPAEVILADDELPAVWVPPGQGALAPLIARLSAAGVATPVDSSLPSEVMSVGDGLVMLTDGRTAAERASTELRPVILLDLAQDYSSTLTIGAASSDRADRVLRALAALMQRAGIQVIALDDAAGLVVMRVVACLANEASDMLTWSAASAAEVDLAMKLGAAYPRGPLAWADARGARRVRQVLANLQQHYGDARYRCSPALTRSAYSGVPFHV